jgi:hypothetical protein
MARWRWVPYTGGTVCTTLIIADPVGTKSTAKNDETGEFTLFSPITSPPVSESKSPILR